MPVRQLTETCWLASWVGDTRTGQDAAYGGHYDAADHKALTGTGWFHLDCGGLMRFDGSGGFCASCGAEGLGIFDEPRLVASRPIVPRPLLGCWEVTCDICDTELEDDDTGTVHVGSFEAAAQAAVAYGWSVFADGRAYCEADAPPPGSGQPFGLPDPSQPALFAAGEDGSGG